MKLKSICGCRAALLLSSSIPAATAAITIDGTRDTVGEIAYAELAVQATTSNWSDGGHEALANIHATQDGAALAVHLAARMTNRAIIIFLDTKPGGKNVITTNTITSGDEEYAINNLGADASNGMTFESGFEADYAIRIFGNGGADAYVNIYDLNTGVRTYGGNCGPANIASGIIQSMKAAGLGTGTINTVDYATATTGVEMRLGFAALGVPEGTQPIRMTGILLNGDSTYASNQVLDSRNNPADIGGTRNTINFETESGTQTLSVSVDNNDNDSDGDPDSTDPDDDNDGLEDIVENDSGFFDSASFTGTDPKIDDSDGDGILDGAELSASPMKDPNVYNPVSLVVAGNFSSPEWQPIGLPTTLMTQVGNDYTGSQYQYSLDFNFTTPQQALSYKLTNATDWSAPGHRAWGSGGPPNSLTVPGGNLGFTVVATGIHRFAADVKNLQHSLLRVDFTSETYATFAAAYGLAGLAADNDDTDTLTNEQERAANTDPTNSDTDGDGLNDNADPDPLVPEPETRDVVFKVNMSVQQALGNFNPATGAVVVKIFSGILAGNPDLAMTDANSDGVYETDPVAVVGFEGANFGTFKFFNTTSGAPNSGYEDGFDRSFTLSADGVAQSAPDPVAYFSNNSTMPAGYDSWAGAAGYNLAPLDGREDDPDSDGFSNLEEFLFGSVPNAATGSLVTTAPGAGSIILTWTQRIAGATYSLVENTDLGTWLPSDIVPAADVDQSGVATGYTRMQATLPTSPAPKKFLRVKGEE